MKSKQRGCSGKVLWDLDPQEYPEYPYEAYEALFRAAYEHAFRCPGTTPRVRSYLERYFRFRVVPIWVRVYVRERLGGEAIANLGEAPLDPAIDLRAAVLRLKTMLLYDAGGDCGQASDEERFLA